MTNNDPTEPINLFANSIANHGQSVDEMMANSSPVLSFNYPDSNRPRNIIETLDSSD